MATPIQSLNIVQLNSTTDFDNKNTISIINQSTDALTITISGSNIFLLQGQTLMLTASTGFVLPRVNLDSSGTIDAPVITT